MHADRRPADTRWRPQTTFAVTRVWWCPGQHIGSTATFYHNQMIPASRGGPCSVRLSPTVVAPSAMQRYHIRTRTADRPGNCLDHPARVVLFGDGAVPPDDIDAVLAAVDAATPGRAGPFDLEIPTTGEQPFQRNAQNAFAVQV